MMLCKASGLYSKIIIFLEKKDQSLASADELG